jgi:ATP-dependent Clp protease ATP-binding subunit ClpA
LICTEHLLLALVAAKRGTVGTVLADLQIRRRAVRKRVRQRLGPGPGRPTEGFVPWSVPAKAVLADSPDQSLVFGQRNVEPEHLLLAIATVVEGGGSEILRALGADAEQIRAAIQKRTRAPTPATSEG